MSPNQNTPPHLIDPADPKTGEVKSPTPLPPSVYDARELQGSVGMPTLYTPKVVTDILAALGVGNFITTACQYAGVTSQSFYEWKSRYPDFADAAEKAMAASEVALVTVWRQQANGGDWRAARDLLGRRWPERWAERHHLTHAGDPDQPIITQTTPAAAQPAARYDLTRLTPDERDTLQRLSEKARVRD